MLWHPDNLGALRDCVNAMIAEVGEDALIGHLGRDDDGEFLDMGMCFSWVCIRKADMQIVGDEGNDYEMRLNAEKEANAIALHCGRLKNHQSRKRDGI